MKNAFLTVDQISDLMIARGYNEIELGHATRTGTISKTLRTAIYAARETSLVEKDIENFFLSLKGHFRGGTDTVDFKFDFYYNLQTEGLRIKAISATMDDVNKIYLFSDSKHLLTSQAVHRDLGLIKAAKTARLIPGRQHPITQKVRHL
jgi:hypothetical protein